MNSTEAQEKLNAEKRTGVIMPPAEYLECIKALLPNHAKRAWQLAYNECRVTDGCGQRVAADRALQACAKKVAETFKVGNAQGWRAG